ncbi:hypothetical protein UCDDA912_g09202 [Diaporthe ampelina]|uniref:DUF7888 domain-containing protein n=1 Tax=Diaporthe ampelina TaxID=1214573 RepID=A0A0G2F9I4_9PEZI|nr:hypothetical protein UCDDA912_g09202 [Diaporthe ampelina]
MKFTLSAIVQLALCASALAAPSPQATAVPPPNANIPPSTTVDLTGQKTAGSLQKRIAPLVVVAGIVAFKGATILVGIAIEIGADTIKNLGEWNEMREAFTKKTTSEMWARNPDLQYGMSGLASAKLELGMLKTDYDCMYMTGNNKFSTKNEGGYINLSYTYNNRCSFDKRSGDLTCV